MIFDRDKEASVTYSTAPRERFLSQVDSAIHESVSKAATARYSSKNALAVSWNKISFFSGNPDHIPYPRNTFQVIISTDGESTYAVFNYKTIVWDGGLASGGRANTGIGADSPHAQAGINAGNGEGFTNLAYGSNILDIDIEQASESEGQYIYELSADSPRPHGCVSRRPASMPLLLSPSSGPMTGGNPVEISNACFSRSKTIQCKFGTQVVKGMFLRPSKALCYAPVFYANKEIKFTLLIDGVEVYTKETFYLTSVFQPYKVDLVNLDNWNAIKPSDNLEMRWEPKELSHHRGTLSVKLFTYQEFKSSYGWQEEITVEEGVGNSGHYKLDPSTLNCQDRCKEKAVGALVLELANSPDKNSPGRLWSRPLALGWFVNQKLDRVMGKTWPAQMCYNWFVEDSREGLGWLSELEDCPCSKDQAIGDIGRFVPDPGCNMYNKVDVANCYYHKRAEHCVRSIWPS
ncbi:protein mesh-like [Watersipora subatra]|uniref:protein mesh-like n=1 Tax=Watersipora subatra TaxID=2589382 RepID=UPI00355B0E0C